MIMVENDKKDSLQEVRMRLVEGLPLYSEIPVKDSLDAANLLMKEYKSCDREYFIVLNLDQSLHPISFCEIAVGTPFDVFFDRASVFREALLAYASGIIVFHNHPHTSAEASEEDEKITEKLFDLGRDLGIELFDHMVFNDKGDMWSIKEKRFVFKKGNPVPKEK